MVDIEARGGLDLDIAADTVTVHVRRQRLVDNDAGEHVGIDDVEADLAVFGFRRGQAHAIDRGGDEVRIQTADRDETAFALVVQHVHADGAAGGLGDVLVRELADRVGGEDDDIAVIGALARQGGVERTALADHQDVVDIIDVFADHDHRGRGVRDAGQRHRGLGRLGADIADAQRVGAGSKADDAECAVRTGGNGLARFNDADGGALQTDGPGAVHHAAGNGTGLGSGRSSKCQHRGGAEHGECPGHDVPLQGNDWRVGPGSPISAPYWGKSRDRLMTLWLHFHVVWIEVL